MISVLSGERSQGLGNALIGGQDYKFQVVSHSLPLRQVIDTQNYKGGMK